MNCITYRKIQSQAVSKQLLNFVKQNDHLRSKADAKNKENILLDKLTNGKICFKNKIPINEKGKKWNLGKDKTAFTGP